MKRFTETLKWDDPEFQDMPLKYKMFWIYILDKCSNAGIWKPNIRLTMFQIGESFESSELLRIFKNHVVVLENGNWFILNFIKFQQGELSLKCRPHIAIINELKKYDDEKIKGILKGIYRVSDTLEVKDIVIVQEQVKVEKGIVKGKRDQKTTDEKKDITGILTPSSKYNPQINNPDINDIIQYAESICYKMTVETAQRFLDEYQTTGWMWKGQAMIDWRPRVRSWKVNGANFKNKNIAGDNEESMTPWQIEQLKKQEQFLNAKNSAK